MNQPSASESSSGVSAVGSVVSGLLVAGIVAALIVGATWSINGRGMAVRTATDLALPVGLLWLFFIAVTVGLWRSGFRKSAGFALLITLFFSLLFNVRFASAVMQSLEYPPQPDLLTLDSGVKLELDAVVTLGGSAAANRFGVPELGGDGQRLLLAAQLWHAGVAKKIICTGSSPTDDMPPSEISRTILESIGVPADVIIEIEGENTAGEMKNLKALLNQAGSNGLKQANAEPRIGLITSAFHLPRAMRLAESEGLELEPLPCAFAGQAPGAFSPREFIPSAGAGKTMSIAIKEYLARLAGQ
ncbi:YdcF family protein [Stieleria varia]|uniref:DUF218 domain-containing protein n=1 Tax=Stieleria varia TaxID=2528005 RepID=A0A5C6AWK7_9BACT|nr:YdcF family protein [Stieleria varia]TWU02504.1 hypothetical protein Pla52n_35540 [Stieleria varia]